MIAGAGTQARRQESQIPFAEERNRRVIARAKYVTCVQETVFVRLSYGATSESFKSHFALVCTFQPRPSSDVAHNCPTQPHAMYELVLARVDATQKRLKIGRPRTRRRVGCRSQRN
jgi:hypothetical protein